MSESNKNNIVTKKDLNGVVYRSIFLQGTFNFERYQGSGWCAMMAPTLKKIYREDEEGLRLALKDNSGFFNSQLVMTSFLAGLLTSLYEKKTDTNLINNIRVSLFGPLAGIGDSLFWFTLLPIMAGLCSSLATEGNLIGPALFFIVYIGVFMLRFIFIRLGYRTGTASVSMIGERTKDLSTAASILGVTVIGGLIATMINISVITTIKITDSTMISIQEAFFDKIIPGFLPILITGLMYYLLKKKVSPTILMVSILFGCLVLSLFGIV